MQLRLILVLLASLLALTLLGCGGNDDDDSEDGPYKGILIGAWSGTSSEPEGHEKEYCSVFCGDRRYFSNDNTDGCTRKLGENSTYLLYRIEGNLSRIREPDDTGASCVKGEQIRTQ